MLTVTLILAIVITCFGSSMLYGYNMSVINLPGDNIKCFLDPKSNTNVRKDVAHCKTFKADLKSLESKTKLTDSEANYIQKLNALYGAFASIFVVSGAIGAFASGLIADWVGRRNGLILNHIPVIIGGFLTYPAYHINSIALLFIARFFIGLNCGVSIAMASMYLTEISPVRWRGAIGACHQLAVTIGIVVGYIATMKTTMQDAEKWAIAATITLIPAAISLFILPFLPESPRYLYIKKNKIEDAKTAFTKFNKESVDEFESEMEKELATAKNEPEFRFTRIFTEPAFHKPLLIAVTIQIMQQLSGINAVITYSGSMLKTAGVNEGTIDYYVLSIGILNVVCTIASLPLLEKFGRRSLLLFPSLLIILTLIVLPITTVVADSVSDALVKKNLAIASYAFIMLYIIGFAFGLGPVPGLIVSEIFTQGPRAVAYSVSQAVQWLSNLLVQQTYPIINGKIRGYSFIPFLVVMVIFTIFFYFIMPETKGKSFEQISQELRGRGAAPAVDEPQTYVKMPNVDSIIERDEPEENGPEREDPLQNDY